MSAQWLIGIDDTDNEESIGTGRLARMLAEHLAAVGLLARPSVTRHQFLVHPAIPYTSHNSSACIAADGDGEAADRLFETAVAFLLEHFHPGANPGLCVCRSDAVPPSLLAPARRAQQEVLTLEEFDAAAADLPRVWSGGPTGQGRIGACSGVALRSTGEDGRFIGLAGIRDLSGTLTVGEIVARSGVVTVATPDGRALAPDVPVDTGDWVRPSLRGGRPVYLVSEVDGHWRPTERRSKDD